MIAAADDRSAAVLSKDRAYRYALWRLWDVSRPLALLIGLNPSTADELTDDPTVRRCAALAHSWGCGGLLLGNLYAYRATDPRELEACEDPVGSDCDAWLERLSRNADLVVAAWGAWHPRSRPGRRCHHRRKRAVMAALGGSASCLGLTKHGDPRHPLYVRASTPLVPYESAEGKRAT